MMTTGGTQTMTKVVHTSHQAESYEPNNIIINLEAEAHKTMILVFGFMGKESH